MRSFIKTRREKRHVENRRAILDDEKGMMILLEVRIVRCTRPDFNERTRRVAARRRDDLNSPVRHSMSSSSSFVFFIYLANHRRQRRKKKKKDAKQK
jgi:hypothetical protein